MWYVYFFVLARSSWSLKKVCGDDVGVIPSVLLLPIRHRQSYYDWLVALLIECLMLWNLNAVPSRHVTLLADTHILYRTQDFISYTQKYNGTVRVTAAQEWKTERSRFPEKTRKTKHPSPWLGCFKMIPNQNGSSPPPPPPLMLTVCSTTVDGGLRRNGDSS